MNCDHRLGEGNRCIFCGEPHASIHSEAFAKTVEPRDRPVDPVDAADPRQAAQNSNRYSHLEPHERYLAAELDARQAGPPRDGHDYTWTRHTTISGGGTNRAVADHSYAWVRDDTLKREKRHDFLSIPIGLFVLLLLYHLVTKL